ncbi:hypothetical protein BgiMline_024282 [Biomphalaria glabrata]|nr:hypothetical protein BgiMline_007481 [Biomphalaria glabrata]
MLVNVYEHFIDPLHLVYDIILRNKVYKIILKQRPRLSGYQCTYPLNHSPSQRCIDSRLGSHVQRQSSRTRLFILQRGDQTSPFVFQQVKGQTEGHTWNPANLPSKVASSY